MKKSVILFLLIKTISLANLENYFDYDKLVEGARGKSLNLGGHIFQKNMQIHTSIKLDKNKKNYVDSYEISHQNEKIFIESSTNKDTILKKYKNFYPFTKFKKISNTLYKGSHEQDENSIVEIQFYKNYVFIKEYRNNQNSLMRIEEIIRAINNSKK